MRLTTSGKRVERSPGDKRCAAIAARFGDAGGFARHWTPQALEYISGNLPKAVEAGVPSLVMTLKTYGSDVVADKLRDFIAAAVTRLGDTGLDSLDIGNIAAGMIGQPLARTLNFALVLHFFTRISRGDFELYGFKPAHVLNAFKRHCAEMREVEWRERLAVERRRQRERAERGITFQEYCRRKGIEAASPLDLLERGGETDFKPP